jgi:hypothetical protein
MDVTIVRSVPSWHGIDPHFSELQQYYVNLFGRLSSAGLPAAHLTWFRDVMLKRAEMQIVVGDVMAIPVSRYMIATDRCAGSGAPIFELHVPPVNVVGSRVQKFSLDFSNQGVPEDRKMFVRGVDFTQNLHAPIVGLVKDVTVTLDHSTQLVFSVWDDAGHLQKVQTALDVPFDGEVNRRCP